MFSGQRIIDIHFAHRSCVKGGQHLRCFSFRMKWFWGSIAAEAVFEKYYGRILQTGCISICSSYVYLSYDDRKSMPYVTEIAVKPAENLHYRNLWLMKVSYGQKFCHIPLAQITDIQWFQTLSTLLSLQEALLDMNHTAWMNFWLFDSIVLHINFFLENEPRHSG